MSTSEQLLFENDHFFTVFRNYFLRKYLKNNTLQEVAHSLHFHLANLSAWLIFFKEAKQE